MAKKVTTPRSTRKAPKKPKAERKNSAPQDTYLPPTVEQSSDKPPCTTTQPVYISLRVDEKTEKLRNRQFWMSVRDDPNEEMKCRLSASELLGKSLAMFTENIDVKDDRSKLAAALINEKSKRENDQAG